MARASVEMPGLAGEPHEHLLRADVFIQSSDTEGMSNALLEAMACGCACVATDVGETRFVLGGVGRAIPAPGAFVEAEAGLLVRPGDVAALSKALRALTNPELRERLSAAARARCLENHSLASVSARYLDLFDRLKRAPPGV